jgi:hypothetical protein
VIQPRVKCVNRTGKARKGKSPTRARLYVSNRERSGLLRSIGATAEDTDRVESVQMKSKRARQHGSPDLSPESDDKSPEEDAEWSEAIDGLSRGASRHRKPTVLGFAPHNMITHHARPGAGVSTTCSRSEVPNPPTSDWRQVDCPECIESRPAHLRLLTSDGACTVCRRQNGRRFAAQRKTPYRAGIRGCSHPGGCRCRIVSA